VADLLPRSLRELEIARVNGTARMNMRHRELDWVIANGKSIRSDCNRGRLNACSDVVPCNRKVS
jgi:hypothetical protein